MRKNNKLIITLAIVIALVAGCLFFMNRNYPENVETKDAEKNRTEEISSETEEKPEILEKEDTVQIGEEGLSEYETDISLGEDLFITKVGAFNGFYVEDGTDEEVRDLLMIKLENHGKRDLQLARVNIQYSDFMAEFEATNVPAGSHVILLEKNRHSYTSEMYEVVEGKNVVFFNEPMSLKEEQFEISGMDGMLNVKNISDEDIEGNIFVYYKNYVNDMFYGGITYRVKIEGGLKAGEIRQVMTGHYVPEVCKILMVAIGGQ